MLHIAIDLILIIFLKGRRSIPPNNPEIIGHSQKIIKNSKKELKNHGFNKNKII